MESWGDIFVVQDASSECCSHCSGPRSLSCEETEFTWICTACGHENTKTDELYDTSNLFDGSQRLPAITAQTRFEARVMKQLKDAAYHFIQKMGVRLASERLAQFMRYFFNKYHWPRTPRRVIMYISACAYIQLVIDEECPRIDEYIVAAEVPRKIFIRWIYKICNLCSITKLPEIDFRRLVTETIYRFVRFADALDCGNQDLSQLLPNTALYEPLFTNKRSAPKYKSLTDAKTKKPANIKKRKKESMSLSTCAADGTSSTACFDEISTEVKSSELVTYDNIWSMDSDSTASQYGTVINECHGLGRTASSGNLHMSEKLDQVVDGMSRERVIDSISVLSKEGDVPLMTQETPRNETSTVESAMDGSATQRTLSSSRLGVFYCSNSESDVTTDSRASRGTLRDWRTMDNLCIDGKQNESPLPERSQEIPPKTFTKKKASSDASCGIRTILESTPRKSLQYQNSSVMPSPSRNDRDTEDMETITETATVSEDQFFDLFMPSPPSPSDLQSKDLGIFSEVAAEPQVFLFDDLFEVDREELQVIDSQASLQFASKPMSLAPDLLGNWIEKVCRLGSICAVDRITTPLPVKAKTRTPDPIYTLVSFVFIAGRLADIQVRQKDLSTFFRVRSSNVSMTNTIWIETLIDASITQGLATMPVLSNSLKREKRDISGRIRHAIEQLLNVKSNLSHS